MNRLEIAKTMLNFLLATILYVLVPSAITSYFPTVDKIHKRFTRVVLSITLFCA